MATRKSPQSQALTDRAQYLLTQLNTWAERRAQAGYDQADIRAALIAAAGPAKPDAQ